MPALDDQLLRQSHLFRHLEPEEWSSVTQAMRRACYQPGEIIAHQGSPVQGLCLIVEGGVRPQVMGKDGRLHRLPLRRAGDVFGAQEMLRRIPWQATMVAEGPTTILCWPRQHLLPLLRSHPPLRHTLQLIAHTHKLARQARLPELDQQEVLLALLRRHPIRLLTGLLPSAAMLLAAALLAGLLPPAANWGLWAAGVLAALAGLLALWRWLDWRNDYYLVTNMRVIWVEKVIGIYESRHEAPLHWVLSVGVRTQLLGRWLGFGDVQIRTYTGQITFRDVSHPHALAALVEEHWRRARAASEQVDRQEILQTLRDRLEGTPTETQAAAQAQRAAAPEQAAPPVPNLWSLEMRIERQGVITYRKHWALLARQVAAPSVLLALGLGLALAAFGGLLRTLSLPAALTGAALLTLGAIIWWLYRFIDWANDLYQISPTHILHVSKKPLASEVRKVAPLDNILGTEVDRKGILGLMLNYGDVVARVGTESFVFRGVFDPNSVQADIVRAQQRSIQRQEEMARAQRRAEVVEWLAAYHEETASRPPQSEGGHEDNGPEDDSHPA